MKINFRNNEVTPAYEGDTYVENLKSSQGGGKISLVAYIVLAVCACADFSILNSLIAQMLDSPSTSLFVLLFSLGATLGYLRAADIAGTSWRRYNALGQANDKYAFVGAIVVTVAVLVVVTGFRFFAEKTNAETDVALLSMQTSLSSSSLNQTTDTSSVYANAVFSALLVTVVMLAGCGISFYAALCRKDARAEQLYLSAHAHAAEDGELYRSTRDKSFDVEEAKKLQDLADKLEIEEHRIAVRLARAGLQIDSVSDPADIEEERASHGGISDCKDANRAAADIEEERASSRVKVFSVARQNAEVA